MKERRRGHILAISSIMGYIAMPRSVSYVATKFAVRGMMQALQRELAMDGFGGEILTTTVFPTFIATRKQLMDLLNELSFDEKLAILTPEEAADATVEGMLQRKTQVLAAPFFIRLFIYLSDLLPCEISNLLLHTITGKLPQLTKPLNK
ncbi:AGAP005166-PA-like protein [Anopheles sinensis]|uniref:AGAP005166-PA-like protein n=1 Tax=Anopheles sinensis TaxID=74873 RepID=A0A084W2C7_ANOSI|nr:AGAP005166-PA-like protein [Anopheles sinensis]